jgi:alpha-tubulin suppressor-like RCC1 family protein
MAEKSARVSLLTHAAVLLFLFKDDTRGIKAKIIKTIAKRGKELYLERSSEAKSNKSLSLGISPSLSSQQKNSLVFSFGKADHGKLGLGDAQLNRLIPTVVDALREKTVVKIASMSTYCLALNNSGAVYIWGVGGTVGTMPSSKTDITPQLFDALPMRVKVVDLACGLGHALFLTNFGRVFSWGSGGNGRLGLGDVVDRTEACLVTALCSESITSVVCGASHSLAITSKGQVYSWGKNSQGQNGVGSMEDCLKPALVKKLSDKFVVQVAAGWEHSLALTNDGKMFSWGSGYKDTKRGTIPPVLGLGHSECKPSPELISSIETIRILSVACGWDHCLALDSEGKVLSWGSGQNGKLGHGNEENISVPCYIPDIEDTPFARISAGCEHSAAISRAGELFAWGHGDGGRLGLGTNVQCFVPTKVAPLAQMRVRPTFLHCGDKFTTLIGHPVEPHSSGPGSAQAAAQDIDWQLRGLQQWLTASSRPPRQEADEAADKQRGTAQALADLAAYLDWVEAADEDSLCRNEEAVVLVLNAIVQSAADHLLDPFDTSSSSWESHRDPRTSAPHYADREFAVELSEDTFAHLLQLLDLLAPLYADHLHVVAAQLPTHAQDQGHQEGREAGGLDLILLQLLLVLSLNLLAASGAAKQEKKRLAAEAEESADSAAEKIDDGHLDGQHNLAAVLASPLRSNGPLSFLFQREAAAADPPQSPSPRRQLNATGSGKFSRHHPQQQQQAEGGQLYSTADERASLNSSSLGEEEDDRDGRDDDEDEDSRGSLGRHEAAEAFPDDLGASREELVPSPAPSYESMEHSQAEAETRGRRGRSSDPDQEEDGDYSPRSSLEGSDADREGGDLPAFATEAVDVENLALQQALLSSLDSSRRLVHPAAHHTALRPVAQRRGRAAVLPKIRNALNSAASSAFVCLQQFFEQSAHPAATSSAASAQLQRIFLTWESTQLATAAGFDCLYDEAEQKAVLLQIVRAPESFLYVIPGLLKGLQRDPAAFEALVDGLFPDSLATFFGAGAEDTAGDSHNSFDSQPAAASPPTSHQADSRSRSSGLTNNAAMLAVEDIQRILESLLKLFDRRPFRLADPPPALSTSSAATTAADIAAQLFDQIQQSFAALTADVVLTPVQWFLRLGDQELPALSLTAEAVSCGQPWGAKMEAVLGLFLQAIGRDLEKAVLKFLTAERPVEQARPLLDESFAGRMIREIFASPAPAADSKRQRPRLFSVCPMAALLPFALRLQEQLQTIHAAGLAFLAAREDGRLFTPAASSGHPQPADQRRELREWFAGIFLSLADLLADGLLFLARPPRRWLDRENGPWQDGLGECFDFSGLALSQLRRHLFAWDQLVWAALPERLEAAGLLSDDSEAEAETSVLLLGARELLGEQEVSLLVRKFFTRLHGLGLFRPSLGPSEDAAAWERLAELFALLAGFFSDQAAEAEADSWLLAARRKRRPEVLVSLRDSLDESWLTGEAEAEAEAEELALCDVFFFLARLFLSAELADQQQQQVAGGEAAEGRRVSCVLLAVLFAQVVAELSRSEAAQFRSLVHLSRLDGAVLRFAAFRHLFTADLADLLAADPIDQAAVAEKKAALAEKICGYLRGLLGELRRFDEQRRPSHSFSAAAVLHPPPLDPEAGRRPEVLLLLLFFERSSQAVLRAAYLEELRQRNRQLAQQLYGRLAAQWEAFSLARPLPADPQAAAGEGPWAFLEAVLQRLGDRAALYNRRHGHQHGLFGPRSAEAAEDFFLNRDSYGHGPFAPALRGLSTTHSASAAHFLRLLRQAAARSEERSSAEAEAGRGQQERGDGEAALLQQLRSDRALAQAEFLFLHGLTAFCQFSAQSAAWLSAGELRLQEELLRWWGRLLQRLVDGLQIHPFFLPPAHAHGSDAPHTSLTHGAAFFRENAAVTELLGKVTAAFAAHTQILALPLPADQGDGDDEDRGRAALVAAYYDGLARGLSYFLLLAEYLAADLSFLYGQLFLGHFWRLKDLGAAFLLTRPFPVDFSSPTIAANLCAPHGHFALGFWLLLPPAPALLDSCGPAEAEQEAGAGQGLVRIHLLSRVPEAGDINMLELVTRDPAALDSFTLSVHLLVDRRARSAALEISVLAAQFDKDDRRPAAAQNNPPAAQQSRKKTIHRRTLRSAALPLGRWTNVFVEVLQTPPPPPPNPTTPSPANPSPAATAETSHFVLAVDGQVQAVEQLAGGKWPLHQNVVIGRLPSAFRPRDLPPGAAVSGGIQLADIVWVPTSPLFEDFSAGAAHYQHDFGLYLKAAHPPRQPGPSASSAPLSYDSPLQLGHLPSDVVGLLAETCQLLSAVLDLFKAAMLPFLPAPATSTTSASAPLPTAPPQLRGFFLVNAPRLLALAQRTFPAADKALQRRLLHLLAHLLALVPEPFIGLFDLLEEPPGDPAEEKSAAAEAEQPAALAVVGSTKNLRRLKSAFLQQAADLSPAQHKRLAVSFLNFAKFLAAALGLAVNPFFFHGLLGSVPLLGQAGPANPAAASLLAAVLSQELDGLQLPLLFPAHPAAAAEQSSLNGLWRLWVRRAYLQRIGLGQLAGCPSWAHFLLAADENALLADTAALLAAFHRAAPRDGLRLCRELFAAATASGSTYERMGLELLVAALGGGWLPAVNDGSVAVFSPRRFLLYRGRSSWADETFFAVRAVVRLNDHPANGGGPGQLFLRHGLGAFSAVQYLGLRRSSAAAQTARVEDDEGLADGADLLEEAEEDEEEDGPDQSEAAMSIAAYPVALPAPGPRFLPTTEMVTTQDALPLPEGGRLLRDLQPLASTAADLLSNGPASAQLLGLLKAVLLYTKKSEAASAPGPSSTGGGPSLSQKTASLGLSSGSAKKKGGQAADAASSSFLLDEAAGKGGGAGQLHAMNQLLLLLGHLRCLAVQAAELPADLFGPEDDEEEDEADDPAEAAEKKRNCWRPRGMAESLFSQLLRDLFSLLSLAVLDPVEAAASVFEAAAFKGVQVDVLRNLLREGDAAFLERLVTKLWRQFGHEDAAFFAQHSLAVSLESAVLLAALQGEVQISGSKVKASKPNPNPS